MNKSSQIVDLAKVGIDETIRLLVKTLQTPGGVALVPTETVYGLICRADDAMAVRRIYDLKDRDTTKPLGWFIGDWKKLTHYGVRLSGLPETLAQKYCPGAITIIAPTDNGKTIGFRVPDYPLLQILLNELDFPLAQTSANLSGHPNALTVCAACEELDGTVDLAVDGGAISEEAQASTVVLATGTSPKILRQGSVHLS